MPAVISVCVFKKRPLAWIEFEYAAVEKKSTIMIWLFFVIYVCLY